MKYFERKINKDQSRDAGMAIVLLLLLLDLRMKREGLLLGAMALHILNMTVPQIYRPVAIAWFGLAHALGTMTSKILLSILFFGVVTPIGMLRRLIGKDSLKLREFKASEESALLARNHLFLGQDLEKPY